MGKIFLDDEYKEFIEAILPFLKVFPKCPLNAMMYNPTPEMNSNDLDYVKKIIKPLLNKTSKEATFILANITFYHFKMDILKVHKGSELLNLNKLEFYPETEESKKVASTLRASINIFVQQITQEDTEWRKYFWNQAERLEPNNIDKLYFK